MSSLTVNFHPLAEDELEALADSADEVEQDAAAQIFGIIALMRDDPAIGARLCGHYEVIQTRDLDGNRVEVNIKIIQALKDCANDRFHVDAIRRLRELHQHPGDQYRTFFAPRPTRHGPHVCEVLGVFHKREAYLPQTLAELRRRYENPRR